MTYLQVRPAYGVTLRSKRDILDYYAENKDFQILTLHHPDHGRYINKVDIDKSSDNIRLEVRYGKKGEKVMILDPKEDS